MSCWKGGKLLQCFLTIWSWVFWNLSSSQNVVVRKQSTGAQWLWEKRMGGHQVFLHIWEHHVTSMSSCVCMGEYRDACIYSQIDVQNTGDIQLIYGSCLCVCQTCWLCKNCWSTVACSFSLDTWGERSQHVTASSTCDQDICVMPYSQNTCTFLWVHQERKQALQDLQHLLNIQTKENPCLTRKSWHVKICLTPKSSPSKI